MVRKRQVTFDKLQEVVCARDPSHALCTGVNTVTPSVITTRRTTRLTSSGENELCFLECLLQTPLAPSWIYASCRETPQSDLCQALSRRWGLRLDSNTNLTALIRNAPTVSDCSAARDEFESKCLDKHVRVFFGVFIVLQCDVVASHHVYHNRF